MILYITLFLGTIVGALMIRSFIFTIVAINAGDKIDQGSEYNPEYAPKVTVLVPAHNEEAVIEGSLDCMNKLDYKKGQLEVIILNDRSTDGTKDLIDDFLQKNPQSHITARHRPMEAKPGKAAAMKEVIATLKSEIIVIFDADYLPHADLIKRLITPFEDPQVGATMGRVVTYNANANIMTKLIDLERRSGYAIDQNIRNHLDLLPQFGGTTGGIRLSALSDVGGWDTRTLTEDTDLTYKLYLKGYKIKYLNAAACFEETPESWQARYKQVRRWAYGHNDCMIKHFIPTLMHKDKNLLRKLDALLLLTVYAAPAALLTLSIVTFLFGNMNSEISAALLPLFLVFCGIGNFSPFFQMFAACIKDKQPHCTRYIPYIFVSSTISMLAATHALLLLPVEKLGLKKSLSWDKTLRYRKKALT